MTAIYEEDDEVGESDEVISSPSNSKERGQLIGFDIIFLQDAMNRLGTDLHSSYSFHSIR